MNNTATVIIPTFNAGHYLLEAVESALEQTYHPLEILIIDDGSTDGSLDGLERIEDPRLRLLRQENAGKSVAMNRAISEMSGAYYCILDADDKMHPERVARQVAALEHNPDVAAVFCGHELLIEDQRLAPRMRAKGRKLCRKHIDHCQMPAHDPTGMYRVAMVRQLPYEPSLRIGQGYDYILRVGERWPMLVLGECLYTYRIRQGSQTSISLEKRRQAVTTVQQRAAERRKAPIEAVPPTVPPQTNRDRDNNLVGHFMESVADLRKHGRWREVMTTALFCLRMHPFDPHYWKPLLVGSLPEPILLLLRGKR